MALPPTPLTSLLYRASTPDAMYDLLHAEGWLSSSGRSARRETIALMTDSLDRREKRYAERDGPIVGPTAIDELARELVSSPYLNSRGAKMGSGRILGDVPPNEKSWWQFWK